MARPAGRLPTPHPLRPGATEPYTDGTSLASLAFTDDHLAVDPFGAVTGTVTGVRFAADVDVWCIVTPYITYLVAPEAAARVDPELTCDPSWSTSASSYVDVLPLLSLPHGREVGDELVRLASTLAATFAVAAADRVLAIAVDYVKDRRQFGVPVGSFQAVKHRAANCFVELLHARSLVRSAARSLDPVLVDAAGVVADEAYRHAAESALQMHGGIGFTTEVPVHRFLKNTQQLRGWPRSTSARLDALRAELGLDTSDHVPA